MPKLEINPTEETKKYTQLLKKKGLLLAAATGEGRTITLAPGNHRKHTTAHIMDNVIVISDGDFYRATLIDNRFSSGNLITITEAIEAYASLDPDVSFVDYIEQVLADLA